MDSINFDIAIGPLVGDAHPITATFGPLGSALEQRPVEPEREPLASLLQWARQGGPASITAVESLGEALYEVLFGGRLGEFLRSAQQDARRSGKSLRLRLSSQDPAIVALPWEFLYDRQANHLLAASPRSTLVRYSSDYRAFGPPADLAARLPLRLLMVAPAAADLDVQAEIERLREAVGVVNRGQALIQLQVLGGSGQAITLEHLLDRLQEDAQGCDILHFSGHGAAEGGRNYLRFDNGRGGEDWVEGAVFARGLYQHTPRLRLAVLNACEGSVSAPAGSETRALLGVAPALIQSDLAAVVAMQYPIEDQAAALFARSFYRALTKGQTAGRVDAAIGEARSRLAARFQGQRSFATPVLFVHSEDARIFDLAGAASAHPGDVQPDGAAAQPLMAGVAPATRPDAPPALSGRVEGETKRAVENLARRRQFLRASLADLELQKAQFGIRVPVDLLSEIRNIENRIEEVERELAGYPQEIVAAVVSGL